MARINLLPWRAERRKLRQRDTYRMLGTAAVGGLLLAGLVWFHYDSQISGQNERNDFLTAEIEKVKLQNKEIERLESQRARLLARKDVIEELQAKRSQMVHLFDSLVRTIPDGVVLTSLKQTDDALTLEGRTQSNARVSTYMRNLEGSGWMTNPDLSIIEAKAQEQAKGAGVMDVKALPYVFRLTVKLPTPSAESLQAAGLVEDGTVELGAATDAVQEESAAPAADAAAPADTSSSQPAATSGDAAAGKSNAGGEA